MTRWHRTPPRVSSPLMPTSPTLVRRSLALVCLALVALVGPNVVLCQGESGHVATESVLDSAECCAALPAATHGGGPAMSGADACGSCRDTRLLVADTQAGRHAIERSATAVAGPHAELPSAPSNAAGTAVPLAATLRPGHVLSTVLRS